MNWKIKALLQKALASNRIGDKLNHWGALMKKNYYSNGVIYHSHECLRKYKLINSHLESRKGNLTALEIGTGYFIIEPLVLSLIGFRKIVSVDVSRDLSLKSVKKQISCLKNNQFVMDEIRKNSILTETAITDILNRLDKCDSLETLLETMNITYIAPYSIAELRNQVEEFDYIFSQVVFEHISPEKLKEIFKFTKDRQKHGGFSVHTVNFIDHFTNDGFWKDKRISEFNFLRYSDEYWNFWTGNDIAFVNRLSYQFYIELCKEHGLRLDDFKGEIYKSKVPLNYPIHPDITKKYRQPVTLADLTEYQRGTFVIST
jgi:hypothetical protein